MLSTNVIDVVLFGEHYKDIKLIDSDGYYLYYYGNEHYMFSNSLNARLDHFAKSPKNWILVC